MELSIPIGKINMPSDIRTVNELRILELFQSGEKLTAPEIRTATGISKPTIMKILQHLCAEGLIRSAGTGSSTSVGGKKPELYVFADERKILSIAFWPQTTSFALAGLVGDIESPEQIEHELGDDLDAELLWLHDAVEDYLSRRSLALTDIYAVVLSTSGTVDFRNYILRYNSQMPAWGSNVHLKPYLEQYLPGVGIYVLENAGKITGRAVLADDPSLLDNRVLTVFTTWGVSGCFIENGRVLNGKDYLIGEIGHMTVSDCDSDICGCGRTGCLESMICGERISRMAEELGLRGENGEPLNPDLLFSLSVHGDAAARRIVRHLAHCFAIMLHNISLVYNPDVIIFQGNFAFSDAYFDRCLRDELASFRYSPDEPVQIRYDRTPLFRQAAKGGVYLVRRYFFSGHHQDTL